MTIQSFYYGLRIIRNVPKLAYRTHGSLAAHVSTKRTCMLTLHSISVGNLKHQVPNQPLNHYMQAKCTATCSALSSCWCGRRRMLCRNHLALVHNQRLSLLVFAHHALETLANDIEPCLDLTCIADRSQADLTISTYKHGPTRLLRTP